ncbi:unnamed protein product [Plutella xylostella]|uniref:(diamondback moth) hypothetical protein n=1 Tax=Plutella xylostella TaxID=51655 RepID=A0A8S4G416_PLUXY|nr:unnamed protein product [Plutella xylostella]
MSGHTETTSNSMKFAPMPMSALLAQLMPIEKPPASPDQSYATLDESDNSTSDAGSKPSSVKQIKHLQNVPTSTPQNKLSNANLKQFISEKKVASYEANKENSSNNQSMCNNWMYPRKEIQQSQSAVKQDVSKPSSNVSSLAQTQLSNKDVVKRSVLTPLHVAPHKPMDPPPKRTPEMARIPHSSQKKSATPKIKSGIRRFTPGSGRRSNKKTPQKVKVQSTAKESVRCLFPDNHMSSRDEAPCPAPCPAPQQPPPSNPVPETPLNRKPMPASYAATPSYPQGVVRNQSKILFKTTVIKGKNYMYIKKLGTGGSSEVYKVLEVGTSCEYAVKCVNLGTDPELARGYVNEVKLLRELQNSDRVIRLYDYEYDRENKFLRVVLEAGETDLSSFLRARGAGLPPALVLHCWEEMLHAVAHIHQHGVIHADLKPANFLLVCGRLKLIDFGIASSISADATSVVRAQATGTYSYISPEALMGGAGGYGGADRGDTPIKISFRSDVWSLGCILYSMVYGRTPFGHIPNLAKLAAILDPNHRIDYPPVEHLPPSLIAALKWCLTYNARARPSVAELLGVTYLQPARSPLPAPLLEKLRPLVTHEEFRVLQRAQL